jgi:hypothetical protein
MEKVVTDKVVEVMKGKADEISKVAGEKVRDVTDKALDSAEETVEKSAEAAAKELEKVAKPLTDFIDKIDDDPAVKQVLDSIGSAFVTEVDGRDFSCVCWGWNVSLKITRRPLTTSGVLSSTLPAPPVLTTREVVELQSNPLRK